MDHKEIEPHRNKNLVENNTAAYIADMLENCSEFSFGEI